MSLDCILYIMHKLANKKYFSVYGIKSKAGNNENVLQ